jgi:hypothetical protein
MGRGRVCGRKEKSNNGGIESHRIKGAPHSTKAVEKGRKESRIKVEKRDIGYGRIESVSESAT